MDIKFKKNEKTIPGIKKKKEYRIAFLVINLNDLGGASIPHRFMLDKFFNGNKKNYFMITNFFKRSEKMTPMTI